jgi:thiamine biosynthesis protein ThiS
MDTIIEEIEITVNGQVRRVAAGRNVEEFLADLGLHPQTVVVEHNREILDRGAYAGTEVRGGDIFELVHFVGGG